MYRCLSFLTLITVLALALTSPLTAAHQGVPVIRIDDYTLPIETWWDQHPYNPDSSAYDPCIISPDPKINIADYGNNIQNAIDALPDGGTILFNAATYSGDWQIRERGNIHFIGVPGTVITGYGFLSSHTLTYTEFSQQIWLKNPDAQDDFLNTPCRNIYFKNITFDRQGTAQPVMSLRTVSDILFDNCTFQGVNLYDDPFHHGLVNGHAGMTNIWAVNCHFVGAAAYTIYWDGLHGGGLINCQVDQTCSKRGGPLVLTNDDFTRDINNDGQITIDEWRVCQFVVIYGNAVNSDRPHPAGVFSGRNCLVKNNTTDRNNGWPFIYFDTKTSLTNPDLTYDDTGHVIVGNTMLDGPALVVFDETRDYIPDGQTNNAHLGKYIIKGNRTGTLSEGIVREIGNVIGPKIICGNCIDDPACTPDPCCAYDDTPPAAPQNLTLLDIADTYALISWDEVTDTHPFLRYRVYVNDSFVTETAALQYQITGLESRRAYTFTVTAVDYSRNESSPSLPLDVRTTPVKINNLIKNPSFEIDDVAPLGYADNWKDRAGLNPRDTTVARTGTASMKVVPSLNYCFAELTSPLDPNGQYEFSIWAKGDSLTGDGLRIRYAMTNPRTVIYESPWTLSSDWTRLAVTFTLPSDFIGGRADLLWDISSGTGWYDDASLNTPVPANFNHDQYLDEKDLAILIGNWLQTGSGIPGDLNDDQIVNLTDFLLFVSVW